MSQIPDREELGQIVRAAWVAWALERRQLSDSPAPWVESWDERSEHIHEVEQRIGEAVAIAVSGDLIEQLKRAAAVCDLAEEYLAGPEHSTYERLVTALNEFDKVRRV